MSAVPTLLLDPTPCTLLRGDLRDRARRSLIDRIACLTPGGGAGDPHCDRLAAGVTVAEAFALLPQLARGALRAFEIALRPHPDEEVLPRARDALLHLDRLPGASRAAAADSLVETLRWRGPPGAGVLAEVLPALAPVAQGRGAVALGLLGHREAVPAITEAFDRLWRSRTSRVHAVGALWALHDLGAPALADRLAAVGSACLEWPAVPALMARAGDVRVVPTLRRALAGPDAVCTAALYALLAAARRLGLSAVLDAVPDAGHRDALLEFFAVAPTDAPERFFVLRYDGAGRGRRGRSWWPLRPGEERGRVAYARLDVSL